MSIHEFHARLSSDQDSSAIFGSLRKMMSLEDLKPARFQASGDDVIQDSGWVIWNDGVNAVAATA